MKSAFICLFCLFFLAGCLSSQQDTASPTSNSAEQKLLNFIKEALVETSYYNTVSETGDADTIGVASGSEASTTNTQENGVDELDKIKINTSAQVIYSTYPKGLQATTYDEHGALTRIHQRLPIEASLKGIYMTDTKVIGLDDPYLNTWSYWFNPEYFANLYTTVRAYDINTDGSLNETPTTLTLDGGLISSRRIDSRLYLVLRHYPNVSFKDDDTINTEALTIEDILPAYERNGVEKGLSLSAENCLINTETAKKQPNIIQIVSIDLSSPDLSFTNQCYVGDAEAIYASQQALYIASTLYAYDIQDGRPVYETNITTDIHKFTFSSDNVSFSGTGTVEGHLGWNQDRKSFRLSEYNGDLRVITYDEDRPWLEDAIALSSSAEKTTNSSPVRLTILRPNLAQTKLETLSSLPNHNRPSPIGKTAEQLYASLYINDKAYLITFRLTDPLYVLNLSDPTDPYIEGELEIEGYSDYLYFVGNNLLIGIGKDAIADDNGSDGWDGGAWYQGVKLSLIDASDPTQPREVDRMVLGKRGTESAALYDHHAYNQLNVGEKTRFTLPIEIHDKPSTFNSGHPSDEYLYSYSALFKFEVDLTAKTFKQMGQIIADKATSETYTKPYGLTHRSRMIGNQVHYLYDGHFHSQPWDEPTNFIVLE